MPPMRFSQLLAGTVDDPYLLAEIHQLLEIKQRSGEAEYGPRREVIHAFITKMLNDADNPAVLPDSQSVDDTMLDALLYRTVMA